MKKIALIREGKIPHDFRVVLSPEQCQKINQKGDFEIVVQSSLNRCFSDQDYKELGVVVQEDISACEILLGVKEVPIEQLIENKTYFFFSHTIKEQAYNKDLLKAILTKNIRLIDYEVLTNDRKDRVIAFGKYAGMVGAHNALMTYGARTGLFTLAQMVKISNYATAKEIYKTIDFPALKIVLTGTGRVGSGAALVLGDMGIAEVSASDFLEKEFTSPVFTQLAPESYVTCIDDQQEFLKEEFYSNPKAYKSCFKPFTAVANIMINGIYWDNDAPAFFTKKDMKSPSFKIEVISDITCDIAPVSSIPSTLRASTIDEPVFGYDPITEMEVDPFRPDAIDVVSVDNMPNEMPVDASMAFGEMFIEHVLEELLIEDSGIIERGTITINGKLGKHFDYLREYADIED